MIFDSDTSTCKRTISLHFKNRDLKRTVTFFGSHYPKKEVPSEVPTNNNNPPPSGRQRHIQNPHLLGDILLRWPTSWWFQQLCQSGILPQNRASKGTKYLKPPSKPRINVLSRLKSTSLSSQTRQFIGIEKWSSHHFSCRGADPQA